MARTRAVLRIMKLPFRSSEWNCPSIGEITINLRLIPEAVENLVIDDVYGAVEALPS